jgi:hypothetical protein
MDPHGSASKSTLNGIRIRIRIKVKIQQLWRLRMEPWRAVDVHYSVVEAQNRAVEDL